MIGLGPEKKYEEEVRLCGGSLPILSYLGNGSDEGRGVVGGPKLKLLSPAASVQPHPLEKEEM